MNASDSKNVLIVDDDHDFSDTLQEILEPRGFSVAKVVCSAEACAQVSGFNPQVALIDLRLGHESGVELISKLKAIKPSLVCIMMTAFADVESAIKAMQDGAYDYLRKPLNSPDLLLKLDRVFERSALQAARQLAEEKLELRNQELGELNKRLQNLVRSATVIGSCTDHEHFPKQLLLECAMSLGAKNSAFYLLGADKATRLTHLGAEDFMGQIALPPAETSLLHSVLGTGVTLHVHDLAQSEFKSENEFGFVDGSVLIFPLLSVERIAEAFILLHNPIEKAFTPHDRELANLLASLSAEVYHSLEKGEALRKSESRFRTLLQNLPGAVLRCLRDEHLTLLYASEKLGAITGYPLGEFVGDNARTLMSLVHPDDRSMLQDRIAAPLRFNVPFEFELRMVNAAGKVRWVSVHGTNTHGDAGQLAFLDIALFDITERVEAKDSHKQLESHVRHLQKLESLGVLAGGIAHDFNNLMVPIMGYADMLLEDFSDNEFARESLLEIQQAVERARDLVQQILTFSRQTETEKLPTQMHLVVKQALKLLRSSLPSTIEIIDHIDRHTGMVYANPTQLHQVVMNIGTNAYHAMEEKGGKLEVTLRRVTVDPGLAKQRPLLLEGEHYAALEVRDTGAGMTEDTLSRIFDPFFTTKEPGKGTGLGLATTHGIVSELKGDIWATSVLGRGSAFHIYLPNVEYGEALDEKNLDQIAIGRGEAILVVDDDKTVLNMAKIMISMLGYAPETVSDSDEAIRLIAKSPDKYVLLLSDYTMPKKTGCDIAQEVRAICPNLPIVISSGHGDLIPQGKLEALGIDTVLPKPYKIRDLADCFHSALGNKLR